MKIYYFDNAATTKVSNNVLNKMLPYFNDEYGNPSTMYSIGRIAKKAIEEARRNVAELINSESKEIIFTSSGTESDNTAIKGIAYNYRNQGNHIITSKIEHPAILNSCKNLEKRGFRVTYLNVDENGMINIEELKNSINSRTILISIMMANNEIGTIQQVSEISKIAKQHGIIFHTDAVQAAGNININVKEMGIDLLSISGHKLHAPKGVGALFIRDGIMFERFMDGGHQENNKRASTENVAGIVGLGTACIDAKKNLEEHIKKLIELRDYYISQVEKNIPKAMLNGSLQNRLPGNANFSFEGKSSEELLLKLDAKGICVSGGSACSTGDSSPSHVLTAIGLSEEQAKSAIRVSFGEDNTLEDVDYLVATLKEIIEEK